MVDAADPSLGPPPAAFALRQRIAAEALGTAALLIAVVGSGIMGERLSAGNDAVALLGNAIATGAALVVLITLLGPVSGAHFNPIVSISFAVRRDLPWRDAGLFALAQIGGAALGVAATHVMFAQPIIQASTHLRDGWPQIFSEGLASFGLLATIFGSLKFRPSATPAMVALYIVGAYWFTASTSFANPAVTLARSLTDSFAGIALMSVPGFLLGQGIGLIAALALFGRGPATGDAR